VNFVDANYQFVTKKNIANLAACAAISAGFTEISKEVCNNFHTQLVALIFSAIVSFGRLIFVNHKLKKADYMLAFYNIVPIFFASTGFYEIGLKNMMSLISAQK
jgi:large-conductance mechanosensitive channel